MSIVKVSVECDSKPELYDFDKSKGLQRTILELCGIFDKPRAAQVYGLKLLRKKGKELVNHYISEETLSEVEDGDSLELVYSINNYMDRIFEHLTDEYKEQSFKYLHTLSVDPEFIKELSKNNKYEKIIEVFISQNLAAEEEVACLVTMVHLFQRKLIDSTKQNFLEKTLMIFEKAEHVNNIKYALSVLHKILIQKNKEFYEWKEQIMKAVSIETLISHSDKQDSALQHGILLLINTMIKCCKHDGKIKLIRELNKYRKKLYENIIKNKKIEEMLAGELYVCQTYILSLLREDLENTDILNNELLNIYRPYDLDKRLTVLMDFEENMVKNYSTENLLDMPDMNRFSFASISSKQSEEERYNNKRISELFHITPTVCKLTRDCLDYYKNNYNKNYTQSQIEETYYEPGFVIAAESMVQILAKILHINREPLKNHKSYQPILFKGTKFFYELFCRSMWLLSKTRRETKAFTMDDYNKVLNILEHQIQMSLDYKPESLKELTEEMGKITYKDVMELWHKDHEKKWKKFLMENECVKNIRDAISPDNEMLINKQRLKFAEKPISFMQFVEEKKPFLKIRLRLENKHNFRIYVDNKKEPKKVYNVENVSHVVFGKNCEYRKMCSASQDAFSIVIDHTERITFIGPKGDIARWIDIYCLLTGKSERSDFFYEELHKLNDMDITIKLLDLQNIDVRNTAPPLPSNPPEKPNIPPKSAKVLSRMSVKSR